MKILKWLTTHFTTEQILGGLLASLVFCAVLPALTEVLVALIKLWRGIL